MTDLSQVIADLCAGFDKTVVSLVSGFPETVSGKQNEQGIDKTNPFRSFQYFRYETDNSKSNILGSPEKIEVLVAADARASSSVLGPETPERPEIEGKPPLAAGLSLFPVKDSEPERPEREDAVADAFSSLDAPLPISAADVQAGVARELRALAEDGREGPDALRDAVEITRAKIRNAPPLAERQANPGLCHACGEPLDGSRPEVAVLNPGTSALHLHGGECHAAHGRRRAEMVDAIMWAAGYGAVDTVGEAA